MNFTLIIVTGFSVKRIREFLISLSLKVPPSSSIVTCEIPRRLLVPCEEKKSAPFLGAGTSGDKPVLANSMKLRSVSQYSGELWS
jgi:hypothetical protein